MRRGELSNAAFRRVCLVIVLGLAAGVGKAATAPPVEISLQAISATRTKTFKPLADETALPTPGLDLAILLRVTDGRRVCSLGDIEISRAVDDTGSTVAVANEAVRMFRGATAQGHTQVIQTVSKSIKVQETATVQPRILRVIPGSGGASQKPISITVGLPGKTGGTTAALTAHLGAPSAGAKALRRIEGRIALQLGDMKTFAFRNIESRMHDPLDLGSPKNVTLEITSCQNGKVTLNGLGETARLGDVEFYSRKGERLPPTSSSRSASSSSPGGGQIEMQYDLGDVDGPIDLKVTVYGATEQVEAPFVFENVELP